jgi:hypothetical protein
MMMMAEGHGHDIIMMHDHDDDHDGSYSKIQVSAAWGQAPRWALRLSLDPTRFSTARHNWVPV